MRDSAREITPMTFLNDDHGKSTIRDFSPKPQAVARRLEAVPEPTDEDILLVVEQPVLSPEDTEALAAEAARVEAELTAELTSGAPDPTSPPVAMGTPEDTEVPLAPQRTLPVTKRGPAPA